MNKLLTLDLWIRKLNKIYGQKFIVYLQDLIEYSTIWLANNLLREHHWLFIITKENFLSCKLFLHIDDFANTIVLTGHSLEDFLWIMAYIYKVLNYVSFLLMKLNQNLEKLRETLFIICKMSRSTFIFQSKVLRTIISKRMSFLWPRDRNRDHGGMICLFGKWPPFPWAGW
jgi:hypothetical protein